MSYYCLFHQEFFIGGRFTFQNKNGNYSKRRLTKCKRGGSNKKARLRGLPCKHLEKRDAHS